MAEKMYIPTFIADSSFKPAVVQPRMFFYNGKKDLDKSFKFTYQSGPSSYFVSNQTQFPYMDHYSTSSIGQDPNLDSDSLLFFNEGTVYGYSPVRNLYTKYWEKYVGLLYNPTTRFVECEAVIPFSRYAGMKLNDVVIYKGNHFHLRAINDYNLQSGECKLQLLGPILDDTFDAISEPSITPIQPSQPSTTTTSSTTSTSSTTAPTGSTTTTTTCVPEGNLDSILVGYSAGSTTDACNLTDLRVAYKTDLWGNNPVVYSSADGCNVLPGFYAPYYGEEAHGTVFQIDQYGDVVGSAQCPSGTTTTPPPPTVYQVGYITPDGVPFFSLACNTTSNILYANVPSFGQVVAGAFIYSDSSGTPFAGGGNWFGISQSPGDSSRIIRVQMTGLIDDDRPCESTTTTTSTTSTSTTTTTAAPTWYSFTVSYNCCNEQTACEDNNTFTVYSTKSTMTLPGEGLSYLYNSPNLNDPVIGGYYSDKTNNYYYYTEGNNGLVQEILPCPAATTTTTQPPCYAIGVVRGRNGFDACCDGIVDTHYFNAPTIEQATMTYGTDPTCTYPNPFNTDYKVGVQYYESNGGVLSGPFPCPDCP